MLSIYNYIKKYPGNPSPVLTIPSLTLTEGIYWMKGENGAGKTSLLKSIAGLITFKGDIAVNDLHIRQQRMGYTKIVNYAEAEPLYPAFLSGKDLIEFYKATKQGDFPTSLFEGLGLQKFMHQKTATYSSGMMKKLSLVLAFIGKPIFVLLDEPLIALDVDSIQILELFILENRQAGVSFLITSHQPLSYKLMKDATTLEIKNKTLLITAQP